jgi:hypothetical protein
LHLLLGFFVFKQTKTFLFETPRPLASLLYLAGIVDEAWTALLFPGRVSDEVAGTVSDVCDPFSDVGVDVLRTLILTLLIACPGSGIPRGRARALLVVPLGAQSERLACAALGALGAGQADLASASLAPCNS